MILGIIASAIRTILAPFTAEAVLFDGVNDYLRRDTTMVGSSNGKQLIFSCWIYNNDAGATTEFLGIGSTTQGAWKTLLRLLNTNTFNLTFRNAAQSNILTWDTPLTLAVNEWSHVLVGLDLSTLTVQVYVNDVLDTSGSASVLVNDDIVFSDVNNYVGARHSAIGLMNSELSEVYLTNEYLDFGIELNRRKFISVDGKPVDLSSDGSAPTGTAPLIYMSGDAAIWNAGTNSGSGGNFTMTGAVTDSVNEPVELGAPAVDFDGVNDWLSRGTLVGAADSAQIMLTSWFTVEGGNGTSRDFLQLRNTGSNWRVIARLDTTNKLRILGRNNANAQMFDISTDNTWLVSPGEWHSLLVAIDLDTTTIQVYVDDVNESHTGSIVSGTFGLANSDASALGSTSTGGNKWNGDLAETYYTDEYLDMSVESNRRKFLSAEGKPVNLGSDGSTPTGTASLIYMSGDASVWNAGTNKGSGGDFTMNGAVTDSVNEPVELP